MKLFRNLAMYVLSTVAAVVVIAGTVLAAGQIGGRPANPDPDIPRSSSIFIYTLDKGESKQDQVMIVNGTDTEKTIDVYPVDGMVTNTGAMTCRQKAEPLEDAGGWIVLDQSQVTVPAQSSTLIDFTITVPENADSGEHNACIAYEDAADEGQVSGSVRIRPRSATRVAITVPGDLTKSVDISKFYMTSGKYQTSDGKDANQLSFNFDLDNTGNVSADVKVTARLKNLFGQQIYEGSGEQVSLPKGPVATALNDDEKITTSEGEIKNNPEYPIWGGWYKISGEISYDSRPGMFSGQAGAAENQVVKSTKESIVFVWPILPILILYIGIIVVIVLLIIWLIVRHRRKSRKTYSINKR